VRVCVCGGGGGGGGVGGGGGCGGGGGGVGGCVFVCVRVCVCVCSRRLRQLSHPPINEFSQAFARAHTPTHVQNLSPFTHAHATPCACTHTLNSLSLLFSI